MTIHPTRFIKTSFLIATALIFLQSEVTAQIYQDYFGLGHTVGVKVSGSHEQAANEANHTLEGNDLIPDRIGAARFLAQATLGASPTEIDYVAEIGIKAWLDEQIAMPTTSFSSNYRAVYDEVMTKIAAVHGTAAYDSTRRRDYASFAFYSKVFTENDAFRQKIAFTLSQVFVASTLGGLQNRGFAVASYYDLLYQSAFGNFRDLLYDISLHPAMGIYLSHFKNQKANPETGTLPDENYAREVMQLFTIGLFELNNDGSLKLDEAGNTIPTYDIEDVQELAKVFTGFSGGAWDLVARPQNEGNPLAFNKGIIHYDLTVPMMMHEDRHDTSPKTMIDGSVLPAGQTGLEDVNDAIDILFNHPNVGPFLALRFIQQLVKSNPSSEYINRVATVFNDNGKGVRGDLEAMFRAILTDPEARDCEWIDDPTSGRLLQPIERITQLMKAFDASAPDDLFWFRDVALMFGKLEQAFLYAPSVFNFFTPFYAENNYVAPNGLVSPEFQLLNATSTIHYINEIEDAIKERPFINRTGVNQNNPRLINNQADNPVLDFTDEISLYESEGLIALIDHIDLLICRGQLSAEVKEIIENTVNQFVEDDANFTSEEVVKEVLFFTMMSPSYMILK